MGEEPVRKGVSEHSLTSKRMKFLVVGNFTCCLLLAILAWVTKKGTVIVPAHGLGTDIKIGLEKAILKQAGLS